MALRFVCKRCRSPIADERIDLSTGRALCGPCRGAWTEGRPDGPVPLRDPVPLPRGMTIRETPDELFIAARCFRWYHLFGAAFMASFTYAWLRLYLMMGNTWAAWVNALLGGAVVNAIMIIGTYVVLAGFLNRVHVRVRDGLLRVSQVPLPTRAAVRMKAADIEQVYSVAEYDLGGRLVQVAVGAQRRDGRRRTLVRGLRDERQALFVEQALERHLKIQDRPMLGELPR